jgi:hypothetical protein
MANREQMTIHKALAELKVLDKRIIDAMAAATFVVNKKNNQEKVHGVTPTVFNEAAFASYDKITDLIKRRNAIKDAVNVSNSVTKVEIGGKTYTVVEAIDKKNHGMTFYMELRDHMTVQLSRAKADLEKQNSQLQQKAEQFVTGLMGNKETAAKSEEYDTSVKTYIKSNTVEMLDPLGIEKKIAELDDMINAFMPEVDAALSVSNALTTISIEY